ncbi:MAG: prolipoprotein diacylglyceryl transferase [Thermogutta sp.]
MWRTLLYIPENIGATPFLGFGILFWLWVIFALSVVLWQVVRYGWRDDLWTTALLYGIVAILIAWVLPRVCVEIPGMFDTTGRPLRGLPIRGYGTMLLLGVAIAVVLAIHRAKRRGLSVDWVSNLALWGIIPGMIGARAFHVIEYWPVHYGPLWKTAGPVAGLMAVLNVAQGGLVVYGSVIGGLLGIALYAWRQRMRLLSILDLLTPCFLIGLAFGRIGCFLNGCCFGGVCELPWAVQFPAGSFAYLSQVEHGQMFLYGIKFKEDSGHPQRLPVVLEVASGSAAAKAGVKPGEHIAIVNGIALGGGSGESPASRLAVQLIAMYGDPVVVEGGRGCVCSSENAVRDISRLPHLGQLPRSAHLPSLVPVIIRIETAEGHRYFWETTEGVPARSLPVHPSQLYSAFNAAVLCLFVLVYEPFRKREGELFAWFLVLYPITRFLLEIIRADEPGSYGGLTIAQVVSLGLFVCGIGIWIYLWRFGRQSVT